VICLLPGSALHGRDSRGIEVAKRVAMDPRWRASNNYQNIDTFEIGITDVDHYFDIWWYFQGGREKGAGPPGYQTRYQTTPDPNLGGDRAAGNASQNAESQMV
jgi:hypothetical protein